MQNIFISNLKNFLTSKKITQSQLAKTLGVSNASITNYLAGTSEPSLSFLQNFKSAYNISLDDFLSSPFSAVSSRTLEELNLSRFVGNFLLYFYDSSAYIGRASHLKKEILKYAVMSIVPSGNTLVAYACFFKDFEKAESLKALVDLEQSTAKRVELLSNQASLLYSGSAETSQSQIFIYLKSFNDQSLIILNNPPSNKLYIGGLGTANSVSRGREHMPSVQYILVARQALALPQGEIYNLLALDTITLNIGNETDKLVELFKNLYLNSADSSFSLEEFQKRKIFENTLESVVSNIVQSNVFRYAKVSAKDDDFYYNLIKDNSNDRL